MRRFILLVSVLFSLLMKPGFEQYAIAQAPTSQQTNEDIFPFNPASFTTPGKVNTLISLSDGRMLLGGSFVSVNGQPATRSLAMIQPDGRLDPNFQADVRLQVYEVYDAALQPDGKIVMAGWFRILPTSTTFFLLRLNIDGSLDDAFALKAVGINGQVFSILMDANMILIGGNFTSPTTYIARLKLDGTADPTFNGIGGGPDKSVRGIAQQSNGKYIIVGEFSSINGTDQVGVARLNENGALDSSFVPGGYRSSTQVAVLKDDAVLVGGENICGDGGFAWYASNGTPKQALNPSPNLLESNTSFLPLVDGGFLVGGWYSSVCVNNSPTEHVGEVWRYASDGSYRTMVSFGSESDVLALALRSDGKVMLGGLGRPETSAVAGLFDGLALLDLANEGLEQDDSFLPVIGDEAEITSLSRYPDGKILVAGNFSHVNGLPRFGLARLLATGSLDTSFQPFADRPEGWSNAALALPDGRAVVGFGDFNLYLINTNNTLTDLSAINQYDSVSALALQADGKVLVGSDFGRGVRRLKADFSGLDASFTGGDAYGPVYDLAVQSDGQILVSGGFEQYDGTIAPGLARLSNTGAVDESFSPPVFMVTEYLTATLYSVTPLANGKLLVGGDFTTINGLDFSALARLDSAGLHDVGFASPSQFNTVKSTCVQADGSLWVGGTDASYFRNPLILPASEDGLIDTSFNGAYQTAHAEGVINVVLCGTEGLEWSGGIFSLIENRPFYSIARYLSITDQIFLPLCIR